MSNPFKNLHRPLIKKPKNVTVLFKETMVRCRLVQDTDTKKISIQVSVRSNVKANIWGHLLIDADNDPRKLRDLTHRAAEFIANYQNESYSDTHNPPIVAKAAKAALEDILKQAERASTRPGVAVSETDKSFNG
jgi:hypothetical protein